MRARTLASFIIGFAVGALCLGIVLWKTGGLRPRPVQAWQQPLPTPASAELPDTSHGPALPSAAPPPTPLTEADRFALPENPPHLAMPLAGVDVNKLPDTFNDARVGHKHEALDIAAPRGTPVRAVAEGNVVKLFNSKQGGLTVYQFDNSRNWCFYYAHLDSYAPGLKEGMLLHRGDTLGYVGTTGDAPPNAPHLHLAVFQLGPAKNWWEGTAIDPLPLLK
jgi:murein DD-endopeptidase MepM/ murein hydrolase activator NlpD